MRASDLPRSSASIDPSGRPVHGPLGGPPPCGPAHVPVLLAEAVAGLEVRPDGTYERRTIMPAEQQVDAQQIFLKRYQTV